MLNFNYITLYIIEIITFATIWLIGTVLFVKKHKKGLLKFLEITILSFIVIFTVTFVLEKPQMELKEIENIEAKSQIKIPIPKTYYHFKDITDKVRITNNIDLNNIGEYNVEFEVDTLIGKYTKKDKVKVIDTTSPEIIIEGDEEYKLSYSKEYEELGFSAVDIYDGDLKDKVQISKEEINENEYNIKYLVEDSSGNKTEKVRHVTLIDDIAPEITLNGNANIYINVNETYKENGAVAKDEKDGDVSDKIIIEGAVDTSKEGEYLINYKVADSNGNEAIKKRKVIVSKVTTTPITAQDGSNGAKGVIYLTFDDGPTTSSTPKILDILSKKGVKATFFILNYGSDGEKLVKREYAEGHTVAIHGYSHKYEEIYQSVDTYMNNITKLQEKIKQSIGYNSTITRFPGGSSNTISKRYSVGIMTKLCKEVVDRGYKYFGWNVDSEDAGGAKSADDVYNNVTKRIKLSRSNVVLMHDFSGNNKTINALERIIDYGINNGYTFKAITESTPMVTHTPNN